MQAIGPRSSLVVRLGLLPLLAAGCGGGAGSPRGCGGNGDCGALSRCVSSACVEDSAPVAALSVPPTPEAFALAELDGSASSDPDVPHGDRVDAHRWTVESLDGACDPPTVTGTDAVARVRFACAGSFRVTLVVVDEMGKESAPASADVAVGPPSHPSVRASADRTVNHVCSGTPLSCTTEGGPVAVDAGVVDGVEPAGAVAYHWSADAPGGGPLDEHRRVTFAPSAEVANPAVRIEVDETAVSSMVDDWVLHVTARDDAGLLGDATTRISVLNRRPVVVRTVPAVSVDHTYSAGAYRTTAAASQWSDPDGDPLGAAAPTGNAVCSSYSFVADGTAIVQCSQSFVSDPTELAGFVATRTVSLLARDPWQAAAAPSSTAITIQNRAVLAASSTVNGSVPCARGSRTAPGECCEYDGEPGGPQVCLLGSWHCDAFAPTAAPDLTDPDGDPLRITWLGGGFVAKTEVCMTGPCIGTGTPPVAAVVACDRPTGTRAGSFTATDGLTSASGMLTVVY